MTDILEDSQHQRFYSLIPENGDTIGNTRLGSLLGWDDAKYWAVRNDLINSGLIERRRGRGGAVRRLVSAPQVEVIEVDLPGDQAEVDIIVTPAGTYLREIDLYEPMRGVIETAWAKDRQAQPISVVVTGLQGSKQTGGRWSRPDIVSVEVKTYLYLPGKYLEVITFEVKPSDAVDVSAVYEALAHLRGATHAVVIFHVPPDRLESVQADLDEIREVAEVHGIGLIVAGDPADYDTWDDLVDPRRHDPDPGRLNRFIAQQLPRAVADEIATRVK